ncbi:phosphodiester glycosidase family protein [Algivirga pacifica]
MRSILIVVLLFLSCFAQAQEVLFKGKKYMVQKVYLPDGNLRMHWNTSAKSPLRSFENVRQLLQEEGREMHFVTNGGIFKPGLVPEGLYVENGKQLVSLNLEEGRGNYYLKPNGVFYIDQQWRGAVIPSEQYLNIDTTQVKYALQSGPMLLIDGEIHPVFNPESTSRYIRSGVGVKGEDAIFVISKVPVTFYEFASFFKKIMKCDNALYLDGAISEMYQKDVSKQGRRHADFSVMISESKPLPDTLLKVKSPQKIIKDTLDVYTLSGPVQFHHQEAKYNVKGFLYSIYDQDRQGVQAVVTLMENKKTYACGVLVKTSAHAYQIKKQEALSLKDDTYQKPILLQEILLLNGRQLTSSPTGAIKEAVVVLGLSTSGNVLLLESKSPNNTYEQLVEVLKKKGCHSACVLDRGGNIALSVLSQYPNWETPIEDKTKKILVISSNQKLMHK